MMGLVLTDIYAMKKNLTLTAVMAVLYMAIGIVTGGSVELVAFFIFFAAMQIISAFAYSERAKMDIFANTLPILRKDVVFGKYVLTAIFLVTATLIGALSLLICDLVYSNVQAEDYASLLIVALIGLLFLTIVIPLMFKYGSEKARYIIVVLYLIPFMAFFALTEYGLLDLSALEGLDIKMIIISFVFLDIILLLLSMLISVKIYEKKEF